jgi:hypothetical protein
MTDDERIFKLLAELQADTAPEHAAAKFDAAAKARILAALDAYEASERFMRDAITLANIVIEEEERVAKAPIVKAEDNNS